MDSDDETPNPPMPTEQTHAATIRRFRRRLRRTSLALETATQDLEMARLAALYEVFELLSLTYPAAATVISNHILETEARPEHFVNALKDIREQDE